ncbi:MAG: L-serine ammonia-lyase, iron-sulfur-dependent, subunit alpha, partial [Eubacteriales bacterium]
QCIAKVTEPQQVAIAEYLKNAEIKVECLDSTRLLDIEITGYSENHVAKIHIANHHTNLVGMEKDGQAVLELAISDSAEENLTDKSLLNVATILEFASTVDVELLRPMIQRQIDCNLAIAWEGLRGEWGANVGQILLRDFGDDTKIAAKAFAAAGSDARMSGCELPVVIVSGSGNQGMTASLPVIVYAQRMGCTEEQLFRALAVSDLITIHQKSGIGRLSAYCGAISAGCGAGAGIAYLCDGSFQAIAHTVVNALAILSGTICDGAKPSCAAKIASAVEAGIMGYRMYCNDREFKRGEGIVGSSVDETIANVGVLAKVGMKKTDRVILQIMTQ